MLAKRKYRILFSRNRRRPPGPKGQQKKLIDGVVEWKRRNRNWGRPRIAQQITFAFGRCHRQGCGSPDPLRSLPAGIAFGRPIPAHLPRPHERQPLEYGSVPVRVGIVAYPLGPGGHGSILAPDHRVRRPCRHGRWCRTRLFNRAIRWQLEMPKYLRVLEVTEIKKVPYVPLSHRLSSGSLGPYRECLDSTLFWTITDLEARLLDFQHYYNEHRTHAGRQGHPPVTGVNADHSRANLSCYRWQQHCRGLYQTPMAA